VLAADRAPENRLTSFLYCWNKRTPVYLHSPYSLPAMPLHDTSLLTKTKGFTIQIAARETKRHSLILNVFVSLRNTAGESSAVLKRTTIRSEGKRIYRDHAVEGGEGEGWSLRASMHRLTSCVRFTPHGQTHVAYEFACVHTHAHTDREPAGGG